MKTRRHLVVVAAAGLIGIGAAGVYASAMSVSATGGIGAGSASAQASCATGVDVHPKGDPTWNATEKTWVYTALQVTGDFSACVDGAGRAYKLHGVGSDASGAAVLTTDVHSLSASEQTITLNLAAGTWNKAYLPADEDGLSYGLIVRSTAS